MIDTIRRGIREEAQRGATLDELDDELVAAAPDLDEEERSSLWLFAWLCADEAPRVDGALAAEAAHGLPVGPRFVPRARRRR